MDADIGRCACGARLVGDPVLEPPIPRPMLGAAIASATFAVLSTLSLWMRPLLALAAVAVIFGVRAMRAIRRDPVRFGGRRTAVAGVWVGALVGVAVGGYTLSGIPKAIDRYRESQAAATRAEMHHLTALVYEYKAHFGTYPSRLGDLQKLETVDGPVDRRDVWDHKILYSSFTSDIAAANGVPVVNQNFEIRSPGPDGIPGTSDDIIMRDGLIVDSARTGAPAPPTLPVNVPLTNRTR